MGVTTVAGVGGIACVAEGYRGGVGIVWALCIPAGGAVIAMLESATQIEGGGEFREGKEKRRYIENLSQLHLVVGFVYRLSLEWVYDPSLVNADHT